MELDPSKVLWQKVLLDGLAIGGFWVVPQSGLILVKTSTHTVTIANSGNNLELVAWVVLYTLAAGYRIVDAQPPEMTN